LGSYVITLTVSSGTISLGRGSRETAFYGNYYTEGLYGSYIKKIELGDKVFRLSYLAFQRCAGLETITIPSNLQYLDAPVNSCPNLKCFVVPSGGTPLSTMFSMCYHLKYIPLPKSYYNA